MTLTDIPIDELLEDRAEACFDSDLCAMALKMGVDVERPDLEIQLRYRANEAMIACIEGLLAAHGVEVPIAHVPHIMIFSPN